MFSKPFRKTPGTKFGSLVINCLLLLLSCRNKCSRFHVVVFNEIFRMKNIWFSLRWIKEHNFCCCHVEYKVKTHWYIHFWNQWEIYLIRICDRFSIKSQNSYYKKYWKSLTAFKYCCTEKKNGIFVTLRIRLRSIDMFASEIDSNLWKILLIHILLCYLINSQNFYDAVFWKHSNGFNLRCIRKKNGIFVYLILGTRSIFIDIFSPEISCSLS